MVRFGSLTATPRAIGFYESIKQTVAKLLPTQYVKLLWTEKIAEPESPNKIAIEISNTFLTYAMCVPSTNEPSSNHFHR